MGSRITKHAGKMTAHFFENDWLIMRYYRFGTGPKALLCFHGYGMHGKQFIQLEKSMGNKYTFFGFDLFFHQETSLKKHSFSEIKKGIAKHTLADLFLSFCDFARIDRFSVLGYSMGSHYAATLVEEIPYKIDELFIAAPSCFKPGKVVTFLSQNRVGNKVFEKMAMSEHGLNRLLSTLRTVGIINQETHSILLREIGTKKLRLDFYQCVSFLRLLALNKQKFVKNLNEFQIKSMFVFGERDRNYPASIGRHIIPEISLAKQRIIDANHYLVNDRLGIEFVEMLHDY